MQNIKKMNKLISLFFILLYLTVNGQAEFTSKENKEKYPFICFDKNEIQSYPENGLNTFFNSLNRLMTNGDNQINIVQIGDSHIQGDIFTNKARNMLQDFIPGGVGARGFIFPYSIARSNNPYNYKISYNGIWSNCKNLNKNCPCGLAGMNIQTQETNSFITIIASQAEEEKNKFNTLRIYWDNPDSLYQVYINSIPAESYKITSYNSYFIEFKFNGSVQSVNIYFRRNKSIINKSLSLVIYGFSLSSDEPGITWNSVGVNGSTIYGFSHCERLVTELQSLYPDLIIISLGTNDAYGYKFDGVTFKSYYSAFISKLKESMPGVPIILTSPGDCLLYRRYSNPHNLEVEKILRDLCSEYHLSFWDYFNIMGGYGSVRYWMRSGLSTYDGVHYQPVGYGLQASMFMESLIKKYDKFLAQQNR